MAVWVCLFSGEKCWFQRRGCSCRNICCARHASKSRTLIRLWIKYSCFARKSKPQHSTKSINNSRLKEDKAIYYLPACYRFNIELSVLTAHWRSSNTCVKVAKPRWAEIVRAFYRLLCSVSLTKLFGWLSLLFVAQVCRSWNLWRISIFGKLLIYQVIQKCPSYFISVFKPDIYI